MSGEQVETLSGDPTLELPEFDSPPAEPLPLLERPAAGRATTVASEQGAALADPEALRRRADELDGENLRRPANWGGFRLDPDLIEFWHGSPTRLHRRLLYIKGESGWSHRRLQP